jgi:pteridine reductase
MTVASRVTLVTGGARRVGAAIVRACARRGDAVIIHAAHSVEEAEALARELRAAGGHAAVVTADLRHPDAPARVIAEAHAAFGRLDVLVNSAANFVHAPPMELSVAQWDEAFALNARAPFFLAQAAARVMPVGGVIVNIVDHLAFETIPSMVAHGAAKASLVHVTRTLARALAPSVRVNAVAPGLVAAPDDWTDEEEARFLRQVPLGRAGTAGDVADAVCWLVDAPYVTGVVLPVDGGRGVAR